MVVAAEEEEEVAAAVAVVEVVEEEAVVVVVVAATMESVWIARVFVGVCPFSWPPLRRCHGAIRRLCDPLASLHRAPVSGTADQS